MEPPLAGLGSGLLGLGVGPKTFIIITIVIIVIIIIITGKLSIQVQFALLGGLLAALLKSWHLRVRVRPALHARQQACAHWLTG
jgi:hypothetical protein